MSRKIISQREARRMQKRIELLEREENRRRSEWASDWPGGVNIWTFAVHIDAAAAIGTAQKLDHAIVAKLDGNHLRLYALPAPREVAQ